MNNKFIYPPNAVRVWRGFRSEKLEQKDFFDKLSTVFVPATVKMQKKVGLDTYIPAIPAGMINKPKTVPDETAILFWNSQKTYKAGFDTLAVRTYTLTHGAVYTPESRADFPLTFNGEITANQPYILFDKSADWMHGKVQHIIAALPTEKSLIDKIVNILKGIQSRSKAEGAIICLGANYLVYWQLEGEQDPGLQELKNLCKWSTICSPKNYNISAGLWDNWPGMDIKSGDSFNMQFKRNWE